MTLAEALDLVYPEPTGLFVELKSPDRNPGLVEAFAQSVEKDSRWSEMFEAGRITVISFDAGALARLRERLPEAPTSQLGSTVPGAERLDELAEYSDLYGVDHTRLKEGDLARLEEAGMKLNLWTVNEVEALEWALAVGADVVTTDHPERLAKLLPSTCT